MDTSIVLLWVGIGLGVMLMQVLQKIRLWLSLQWIVYCGIPKTLAGDWKPPVKSQRTSIPFWLRYRIAYYQNFHCLICFGTLNDTFEIDHQLALTNRGSNDIQNLRAVHADCHSVKTFSVDLQDHHQIQQQQQKQPRKKTKTR